jgi:hypothetical protein
VQPGELHTVVEYLQRLLAAYFLEHPQPHLLTELPGQQELYLLKEFSRFGGQSRTAVSSNSLLVIKYKKK